MIDTDFLSPSAVNTGILLVISGAVGTFVLDGELSAGAGLVTGLGAVAVLESPRRGSTWSFGVGTACLLWVFLLLGGFTTEVMVGLGVTGSWFLVTADMDATIELWNTGTVGATDDQEESE